MNLVLNAIHDLDFPDDISTHGLNKLTFNSVDAIALV